MVKIQKLGLILVLALGMLQITPLLAAPQGEAPQGQTPQDPSAMQQQAKEKTFKGTIAKSGETYLLKTAKASYQLDDQEKAKSFEGKDVKVTGTLDAQTQTIHVSDIQPAS